MGCITIKEFKDKSEREALGLIHNPLAKSYQLFPKNNPNSVVITPTMGSKIKTAKQAELAAESMLKKLEKEYGDKFPFDVYGQWGTIRKSVDGSIRVVVEVPNKLIQAYEKKEYMRQQELRGIDYFNSDTALYEQEQRELDNFFDFPAASTNNPLNFNNYVEYKNSMLDRTEKALLNLQALRKHDKSKEINSKIRNLEAMKTKLSQDIKALMNPETVFEQTMAFINEDLALLDELLDNNNIDNLHTAEKMLGFYESLADYTYGSNNPMINTKEDISDDIKEVLDTLGREVNKRKSKLNTNKESYLQDLVDNSSHVQALFPGMEVDQLLQDIKDIDVASQFFLTVDKQFIGDDSLLSQLMKIELERSRSKNKAFVANIKARMDAVIPSVKKKLPKIVNVPYWFGKSITESDYSIFYQKDGKGNKSGKLIDKFSTKWDKSYGESMNKINGDYYSAISEKDWNKANSQLERKFKWIDNHAEFVDITKLPEVVQNKKYAKYLQGLDTKGGEAYKQELINKLGENYYNKIVEKQLEQLEDFESWAEDYIESILVDNNVSSFDDLPDVLKYSIQVTLLRNNPFEVVKSQKAGQGGRVDYLNGNQSQQFQSNVKFIEFFPKEQISAFNLDTKQTELIDSGYYDADFKKIESDPDLYKFWEIMEEATSFINMTLADSEKQLKHGSILSMKKSFWDILVDPKSGIGNKFIQMSSELKQNLKGLITSRGGSKLADDFQDINKAQFKTNEEEIYKRNRTAKLRIEKELGNTKNKRIDLSKVPQKAIDVIAKELGVPNDRQALIKEFGKMVVIDNIIKDSITNQVIDEQTFNLPVIMRAYLEMTAEYKAQKESQPQLSVYKQFYEDIKRQTSNSRTDNSKVTKAIESITDAGSLKTERVRANKRLNHWYNKNVIGRGDTKDWINFGKVNWASYDRIEKELKKELESKLKEEGLTEEAKQSIQAELDNLGANVTLAAIYNSMINKFSIFRGLAFSVKSNMINRFQGWFQGMVYDTGKYWTAGNFEQATNFIAKKSLRYVPGQSKYKNEINKVKLLINELNILQDATNEIDRARNESGLTGLAKKVQPFYLTEYTEWHNQVPQILSMLMDKTIKDKDGNEFNIFNGKELVPYEIKDGVLKLKEEFATPENLETWEDFSNNEAADNKLYMSEIIGLINGDYSRTGNTYVKKGHLGKTAMLFKTWMPNAIYSRFASKQTNLMLGKKELDGIYTSHRPVTLGATLATAGMLTAGLPLAAPAFALGFGIGAIINKRQRGINVNLKTASETAEVGKAILKKMIGIPVNAISGKQIVKQHEFGNLAVTEQDAQNLKSIVNEMAVLLTFVLFKIMVKGLLGDNEEDEPKTFDNKKAKNPYYPGNPRSEREKMMHNVLENEITRIIGDLSMYHNPEALMQSTVQRNALYTTFEDVTKLFGAVQKWNEGLDEIQSGPNKGESRLWNQTKKMTLPGIMQHPTSLGFEKSMETEYDKTEYFDSYFHTDYKKDKKIGRADRQGMRERLTEEFQKEFNYDTLSPADKIIIDDIIKKQVNKIVKAQSPYPMRLEYDEKQKRIE